MDCKEEIRHLLREIVRSLTDEDIEPILEHPSGDHGDYSTNVAMQAFRNRAHPQEHPFHKTTASFQSPIEFAEKILEKFLENKPPCVERVEIAKPGFINFWLSPKVFGKELELALRTGERYGSFEAGSGETMVLDHSHPNIAKRFGIGHLRSTIIGQALVNIYRFLGWNVISENFLGDWGTQFGALLVQVARAKRKTQNAKEYVESLTIDDLEKLYVEFNKEAEKDPKLWEEARKWFKKLEDGDQEAREIWQTIRDKSLEEFKKIWDLLGAKFDYMHSESFFEDKVRGVIEEADKKGIGVEDQGAIILRVPGFESPLILQKSDGATTYETRDLAAIKFWAQEFNPDLIAYEVGVEQSLHFQQVFAVSEMLEYIDRSSLIHIKHGLYLSSQGKKMRTRTGETVKLEDVLIEAIERARKLAGKDQETKELKNKRTKEQKSRETSFSVSQSFSSSVNSDEVANAVGIGAIKYFDLSHHPSSDIVFDWEKIFQLEGNSAPYIQYTYARIQSVLGKAMANDKWPMANKENLAFGIGDLAFNPEELAILRYFYRFQEVVQDSAYNFSPNLLCNFLFELSQKYNAFYNKHRILDPEFVGPGGHNKHRILGTRQKALGTSQKNQNLVPNPLVPSASEFRLALTKATGNILKTGLNLLGIATPERM